MWSVGNEPRSYRNASSAYFGRVAAETRALDPSRPITLVTNVGWDRDLASQHFDIIAINRYFGWYSDTGSVMPASRDTQ
jgi:beta-glucuronidase